jgi:GT2 family glycosyltransferase
VSERPHLVAVVVTFNRLDQLQITVERLLAEACDLVLVVDNASSDGTADWLAAQSDPRLHVLRLTENSGGAGGFEAGLAMARDRWNPDWCVLMDDDARPMPGACAAFRSVAANIDPDTGAVGVIGAAVLLPDGRVSEMNRPGLNPFWHMDLLLQTFVKGNRAGFHLDDAAYAPGAAARDIDLSSFVGYFVSRGTLARAGLPEGGLFIYGDDVLYSLRLRRKGIGIRFVPSVRFEHDCATMGEGFVYRPLWKIYYHCRNGVDIARQAAGPVVFPAALAWYVMIWWRRGLYCPAEDRALYRKMMWTGLRDGLRGRRGRNDVIHQMATLARPVAAG